MQKRSSKSESTRKTEQNRSCWKFLTLVKVNGQRSTDDVAVWRHLGLTWQDVKHSRCVKRVGKRGTNECGGTWSACSWGKNFSRRVAARVMQFLTVLGWVLLGISRFVFLCLFFGCWMSKTLISESCRYCGRDNGGSLLTVTIRWRWGQRKNAGDVHRNQRVRGMALIPC